jgi:uncharacterized membrane protein
VAHKHVRGTLRRDLGPLLADDPKMSVAVVFYLTYAIGIMIFAMRPVLASADWRAAALYGALFGISPMRLTT